jgi:thiamine-phosphate pyrophosphorylase
LASASIRVHAAPALYLITDRQATAGRPLLDVLEQALVALQPLRAGGGRLPVAVQLREKDLSTAAITVLARDVRALTKNAGVDLYVNGRLDVAIACGADGVHLPVDALSPHDVRAIAPAMGIASSTHTLDEVAAAARGGADFVVFGPIAETPSKRGLLQPRGMAALAAAIGFGIPVVALGGLTPAQAPDCRRAGAAGVACVRAVLAATNPGAEALAFLARFGERK